NFCGEQRMTKPEKSSGYQRTDHAAEDAAMSPTTEQILQAALALPDEEQLQLIEALLAALDHGGGRPFDDRWMTEIRRRSAEIDAGTAQPVPWLQVKQRARQGDRTGG